MGSLGYIGLLQGFYNGSYPPENVLDVAAQLSTFKKTAALKLESESL